MEANPQSGQIAVEPFVSTTMEKHVVLGVAIIDQRQYMAALKVVFGNKDFCAGDTVYFEGGQCASPWAKRVYELRGQKFVLAPTNLVILVDRAPVGAPPVLPPAGPPGDIA
jgi:hypothetical protein